MPKIELRKSTSCCCRDGLGSVEGSYGIALVDATASRVAAGDGVLVDELALTAAAVASCEPDAVNRRRVAAVRACLAVDLTAKIIL